MKKHIKLLIVLGIILVGSFSFYLFKGYKKDTLVYENNKIKPSSSGIAMMLETEAGSGNYEMTTRSEWPTDGYVFNTELSKCENGSKLSWDNENKKVLMSGNVSDKCYVYFDKYNPITINNYSITSNGNSITITIDAIAGTGTIAKYLYSKHNGVSYVQSANNTYTFTGLDKGTYNIKAYVQDSNGKNSEIISKTIEITSITLADYVKSLYTGTQGANNIYHHTSTLTNGAGDNSYRYAGANPNNYVCFGSTQSPCPTDNLYRIIGVFGDQVKLIKYDYANSNLLGTDGDYTPYTYSKSDFPIYKGELTTINRYFWNKNGKNIWSISLLNKTNLNKNFITNIGADWAAKIAETTWKVGGNTGGNTSEKSDNIASKTPSVAYQNEITNGVTEYSAKIGLMYVSDYGFAAEPSAWTLLMGSYDNTTAKSTNWMYMGLDEWTISRGPDSSYVAFRVNRNGQIELNYSNAGVGNLGDGVRPSFNLSSSITYVSGSGSANDPIVIN